FVLNTSAYTAEIIRGAINGLPKGEVEAAKAYGMSKFMTYKRIILPSALRRALPAYSNEVIFMLHGSAVAGIVTIVDLTGA
ncbi:ABC transporter permease subunit, partial [Vibrio sp. Vb2736]